MSASDAVGVGSGPHGLAAAITLAEAGLSVTVLDEHTVLGGGMRSLDLGLIPERPLTHDMCAAVHPLALASPFFHKFDLAAHGVRFAVPEVSYAHVLDDAPSVLAYRSIRTTARELGPDGYRWRALFEPFTESAQSLNALMAAALGDKRSVPLPLRNRRGIKLATHLGLHTLALGTPAWDVPLGTARARALLAGVASHAIAPLQSCASAGTALVLAALAHAHGWPIALGGSQVIADAMVAQARCLGVRFTTGVRVRSLGDVPASRILMLNTSAEAASRILGGVPRIEKMGHRSAAAKVDYVLSEPIPWRDPRTSQAATVHVGGYRAEIARAEARVHAGVMPDRPVVLVSEPATFDPSRIVTGPGGEQLRPVWAYAHVPLGSRANPLDAVNAQIERFAPGFRDTIVAARAVPASRMAEHNSSLVDGDIAGGTVNMWRLIARPTLRLNPYDLGDIRTGARAYLCSAATAPGPGVHGMSGYYAATRALAHLRRASRRS